MSTDETAREVGEEAVASDPVTQAIVDRIVRTGIGGRLPSERELTAELGVSRTLLRDRLTLIEALGVIERTSGRGTHVHPLNAGRLGSALDLGLRLADHTTESLQSVRQALERQAAGEAARRTDRINVARMQLSLDIMTAERTGAEVEQADFDFHAALMRASGNVSLLFFTDALGVALRRSFAERRLLLEKLPDHHELTVEVHEGILDAVVAGDPLRAMTAMDEHFARFDHAVAAMRASEISSSPQQTDRDS